MSTKICILDDDAAFLQSLRKELTPAYSVDTFVSAAEFRAAFAPFRFDLIVLDVRLDAPKEGLDILREIHRADPFQPVVVATAYADTETYLDALQAGALLYVDKTRHRPSALALLFDAVIQQGRLRRDQAAAWRALERMDPTEMIGTSDPIRSVRGEIDRLTRGEATAIAIVGETGSGRELVARNLHANRRDGLLRPLAVLAPQSFSIPDLRRMLFGSDAPESRKRGLLEDAHGSGLVVRSANHLPREILGLIVNAWSERQYRPAEATLHRSLETNLYFVCDDARNVNEALAGCQMTTILVPSLRTRKEDIPLLATYLLEAMKRRGREGPAVLDPDAMSVLVSHDWPGNVAELKASLEYASLRAMADLQSVIRVRHLPVGLGRFAVSARQQSDHQWDVEYQEALTQVAMVDDAIRELGTTNKTKLARLLNVDTPTTLTRRVERSLKRYPDLRSDFTRVASAFTEKSEQATAISLR